MGTASLPHCREGGDVGLLTNARGILTPLSVLLPKTDRSVFWVIWNAISRSNNIYYTGAYQPSILCQVSIITNNQWVRLKGKIVPSPKVPNIFNHHRTYCCRCTIRFLFHIRELSTLSYDMPLNLQHHVRLALLKIMTPVTWYKKAI